MQNHFLELLRTLDDKINMLIQGLSTDFTLGSFIILMGLSFLYGLLHSIGPGHGKTLVASFFLKESHPLRKSLRLATIISLIHSGSAVIISVLLYYVLTGIQGFFHIKMQSYFMVVSGILIVIIGVFFLIYKILHKEKDISEDKIKNKGLVFIGISAGIVPCPAALMIMLFTLSNSIPTVGLASVAGISAGMFILLSGIGYISIKSRKGIMAVSQKIINRTEAISAIVEYLSIILMIFIGMTMSLKILLTILGWR